MKFCTTIHCIDGRIQLPVIHYLKERFQAEYADCVTDSGPNRILSEGKETDRVEAILKRVQLSIEKHSSTGIAIAGHHDCAGNPATKEQHIKQINEAVFFLKSRYPKLDVIGLWVDENWEVNEVA